MNRIDPPPLKALLLTICLSSLAAAAMATDAPGTVVLDKKANDTVLYLGKIGVTGHEAILATLQAIKVSLKQPTSSDAKLADVMVCRLEPVAGSNTKQWLNCATNRVLNTRHAVVQANLQAGLDFSNGVHKSPKGTDGQPTDPGCSNEACYGSSLAIFDEAMQSQPGKYLHVKVNGAALHGLLEQIPDAVPDASTAQAPQAATVVAPAAITAHL